MQMNNLIQCSRTNADQDEIRKTDLQDVKLLPLVEFLELGNKGGTGVWLDSDEAVETLAPHLDSTPVVALNFSSFSDGRCYSSAVILRRRYAYQGEIRAVGDVRLDQLEQMSRCGFDAYELACDQDREKAKKFLEQNFSYSYPSTVREMPLFADRYINN